MLCTTGDVHQAEEEVGVVEEGEEGKYHQEQSLLLILRSKMNLERIHDHHGEEARYDEDTGRMKEWAETLGKMRAWFCGEFGFKIAALCTLKLMSLCSADETVLTAGEPSGLKVIGVPYDDIKPVGSEERAL